MDRTRTGSVVQKIPSCVILFFLLLMSVIGIAWIIMAPHDPSFRVESLSVSNFSVSDSQFGGTYDIGFTITNPNRKIDVLLDEFNVMVCYDEVELSEVTVQPIFIRRTRENLTIDLVMKADSPKPMMKKKKVFAEAGEHWRKRLVNFNVRMELRVGFKAGIWPARFKLLSPHCGDLDVFFGRHGDTGKLLGIGKDCHV